ncbi:MAG: hypothetical protein M3Y74_02740 [Chloroflexota bacterium]|nr:hypothetical protein [Chloroflexota bacterium]
MTTHRNLHPGFERLIGVAAVDPALGRALLHDPRDTALRFGLTPGDADLAADIHAVDLRAFASALLPRLYGKEIVRVPQRSAVAG